MNYGHRLLLSSPFAQTIGILKNHVYYFVHKFCVAARRGFTRSKVGVFPRLRLSDLVAVDVIGPFNRVQILLWIAVNTVYYNLGLGFDGMATPIVLGPIGKRKKITE